MPTCSQINIQYNKFAFLNGLLVLIQILKTIAGPWPIDTLDTAFEIIGVVRLFHKFISKLLIVLLHLRVVFFHFGNLFVGFNHFFLDFLFYFFLFGILFGGAWRAAFVGSGGSWRASTVGVGARWASFSVSRRFLAVEGRQSLLGWRRFLLLRRLCRARTYQAQQKWILTFPRWRRSHRLTQLCLKFIWWTRALLLRLLFLHCRFKAIVWCSPHRIHNLIQSALIIDLLIPFIQQTR